MKKTKCSGLGVLTVLALLVFLLAGCRALDRLGDREKFDQALNNALKSKTVILPAVGAAVFSIGQLDERTSDWAVKQTPVFGGRTTAKDFSDAGVYVLMGETAATAFIAPEIAENETPYSKLERPAVELSALGATMGTTAILKSSVDRTRPDNSGDDSFPSAHTSASFAFATLSNRNLGAMNLTEESRERMQFGNLALASAVGWSRIEAGKHFPTDVLGGAAIGSFFSIFIHDWLIGPPGENDVTFLVVPFDNGGMVQVAFSF
jgi:membrane-associated phospholipid phosphatase